MTAKPKADKRDPVAEIEATTAMIEALTADVRRWRAEDRATWARIMADLEATLPEEERVALRARRLLEASGILDREDPA
jgi:hypothetical protein